MEFLYKDKYSNCVITGNVLALFRKKFRQNHSLIGMRYTTEEVFLILGVSND